MIINMPSISIEPNQQPNQADDWKPHQLVIDPNQPPQNRLFELSQQTGYPVVQENGQRRFGPPPGWQGQPPARGCEVFIGKIPRDVLEDELVPIFERIGKLYEMRLMLDFSGSNRGFGFVKYTSSEHAQEAIAKLNNCEIRPNQRIGVVRSVDNCRLFFGGIPRTKSGDEIMREVKLLTDGVKNVIVYPSFADKSKNRGFAFVEYESHRAAALARRKLIPGKMFMFGQQIAVDWAEPEPDVDESTMSKVKILYIRNLAVSTSEDRIRQIFESAVESAAKRPAVERVRKLHDYAFAHFFDRGDALAAMHRMNGATVDGAVWEVVLAKPPDQSVLNRCVKSVQKFGYQTLHQSNQIHQDIVAAAAQLYMRGCPLLDARTLGNAPTASPMNGRTAAGMQSVNVKQTVMNAVRSAVHGRYGKNFAAVSPLIAATTNTTNHIVAASAVSPTGLIPTTAVTAASPTGPCMILVPAPIQVEVPAEVPQRSSVQILEEWCIAQSIGAPVYQLQTNVNRDPHGQVEPRTTFSCKVTVPSLQLEMVTPDFTTDEEAREFAARLILYRFGLLPMTENFSAVLPPQSQQQQQISLPLMNGMNFAATGTTLMNYAPAAFPQTPAGSSLPQNLINTQQHHAMMFPTTNASFSTVCLASPTPSIATGFGQQVQGMVMPWYYQANVQQQPVAASVPQTPTAATTLTPVLLPAPPVGIWPQQHQQLASPQDPPQHSIFAHAMYPQKNLLLNGMQPGSLSPDSAVGSA